MSTLSPDRVEWWLAEIPAHARWLPAALISRAPSDGPNPNGAASFSPLNLAVTHLLDSRIRHVVEMEYCDPERVGVLPYLWGWVRDLSSIVIDERGPHSSNCEPDQTTIDASCAYLSRHLDVMAEQPQWQEFAEGIRYTHHAVTAATEHVRGDARHDVACGSCHVGWLRPVAWAEWQCTACERRLIIRPTTLPEASRTTGAPLRTLQHWAKQGRFVRVEDQLGRSIYDLGQIAAEVTRLKLERALKGHDTPGPRAWSDEV